MEKTYIDLRMIERFGTISDHIGPSKFLKEAGYKRHYGGWIPKEGVKNLNDMTIDELDCLLFLMISYDSKGFMKRKRSR